MTPVAEYYFTNFNPILKLVVPYQTGQATMFAGADFKQHT